MPKHFLKLILIVVVLAAVSVLTVRYYMATTAVAKNPIQAGIQQTNDLIGECGQCHEMKPEIATWQVSAHDKFSCITCHEGRKAADYVGKHQSQSYSTPIKEIDAIPNSICLKCHSANRVTSPSGDLKIPHEKHLNAGVACVKCHYGVVHAKISERDLNGIADLNDYDSWNVDVAAKVSTKFYIQPSMWTCIDCHKQTNTTRKCGACHTTIPALPSHDSPNWRDEHGKAAHTSDLDQCIKCHAMPGRPTLITPSTGDKATDFARAQEFCYKCHLLRPPMHEKAMVPIHTNLVAKKSPQNCLTCHDTKQPQPAEKVPKVFCNQCHWYESIAEIKIKAK